MKWYERAKNRLKELGFTQDDLIQVLNVKTRGAVGHYLTGRREPTQEQLMALAKKLGWTIETLLTGKIENKTLDSAGSYKIDPRNIPVVGTAQLGDNGHWSELEHPVGYGDGNVLFHSDDPNAYALRCVGDSMTPRIKDGEFVIAEPNTQAQGGDEVVIRAKDGRVMVKTYLYEREGRIHLMSINEAHPPQFITTKDIEIMHPISAIVKKVRWINSE